jgi:hypothetical protein
VRLIAGVGYDYRRDRPIAVRPGLMRVGTGTAPSNQDCLGWRRYS